MKKKQHGWSSDKLGGITAFICCYNHGRYLGEAVYSLVNQSIMPKEILLLDDGSTDGSFEVMAELADKYPKLIKLFKHIKRAGHIASYNEMIDAARYEFVHLMAADDRVNDLTFYREALSYMECPNVGFVSIGLKWIDENGNDMHVGSLPQCSGVADARVVLAKLRAGNWINGGGTLVRKTAYQEAGGYDNGYPMAADWMMWSKLCSLNWDSAFIRRPGYSYRRHKKQMTTDKTAPPEEREKVLNFITEELNRVPEPRHGF